MSASRRRHWGRWAPFLGAALVLALVAVTGGFRAAVPVGPRRFTVGETIELRRWTLAVEGVELVDTTMSGSPTPPALRVRIAVTSTQTTTAQTFATHVVGLVVPGGPAPAAELDEVGVDGYTGGFDPDVERPLALEAVWPDGATEDSPRRPAPTMVQVVLSDERPAQNFLFADQWVATSPLGHVDVPLVDRRTR